MAKQVASIKNTTDTREYIPSKEEACYEDANTKVAWTSFLTQKIYNLCVIMEKKNTIG